MRIFAAVSAAAALVAYSSCAPNVPDTLESGFRFSSDAFTFNNFAGEAPAYKMTTPLMVRMFGADKVCVSGSDPCELNAVAQGWLDAANAALADGRSEGFAVLSQLFFLGQRSPTDFGASTVAELSIEGNTALQAELAYWATTQRVPAVLSEDRKFQAKEVMPFLAEVLKPGQAEAWRIAIAMKTDLSFKGGHAMTPLGFYKGPVEGEYFIRVYDNNLPVREGRIRVNVKDNTWSYQGSADPDADPRLYEGTPENHNLLYFSPVTRRTGVLPCPFADESATSTFTTSGEIAALVQTEDGRTIGVQGGQVLEATGGTVVPSFAACDCTVPSTVMNTYVTGAGSSTVTVGGLGSDAADGGTLMVNGPGLTVQVNNVSSSSSNPDTMTVSEGNKRVSYSSPSSAPVNLTTWMTTPSGSTVQVTVTVSGDADKVVVDGTDPNNVKVRTEGAAAGTDVKVAITTTTASGSSTTSSSSYTSTGAAGEVNVNPTTGVTTTNAAPVCNNGKVDLSAGETDVDCGGSCPKCTAGKRCAFLNNPTACAAGLSCASPDGGAVLVSQWVCRTPSCDDGRQDGDETGFDCGGSCPGCAGGFADDWNAPPPCNVASDCDTGLCLTMTPSQGQPGKYCQGRAPLSAAIANLPAGATLSLDVTRDGTTTRQVVTGTGADEFSRQTVGLGDAFAFSVSVAPVDGGHPCSVRSNGARAGSTSRTDYTVTIDCAKPSPVDLYVQTLGFDTFTDDGVSRACRGDVNVRLDAQGTSGTVPMTFVPNKFNLVGRVGYVAGTATPETYTLSVLETARVISPTDGGAPYGFGCNFEGPPLYRAPPLTQAWNELADFTVSLACHCGPIDAGWLAPPADGGVDAGADAGMTSLDAGAPACSLDTDCASSDCECGINSGACTGNTGRCGAARRVFSTAVSSGTTPSGTFTVPAGCPRVHVSAWGAAGGSGGQMFPPVAYAGGAGGFVEGTLAVDGGDVITAWVGNGGDLGALVGTASLGSYLGVAASGGQGGQLMGGNGGGLTSVECAGTSFSVPGGGGGALNGMFGGGEAGHAGGNGTTRGGGDGAFSVSSGGGGAGDPGGTGGAMQDSPGNGGAFGTLPPGFTSSASSNSPSAPQASLADYALCPASTAAGNGLMSRGGDGCVVVRCVAP